MAASDVLTVRCWNDYGQENSLILTLPDSGGKKFLSFTASFVTFVGGAVWAITAYTIFQVRAGSSTHSVAHHQLNVHLSNSGTPGGFIWNCFRLLLAWRKTKMLHGFWVDCVIASLGALTIFLGFFAASIFSSQVSTGINDHVQIQSSGCGMFEVTETPVTPSQYLSATINPSCDSFVARELTWSSNYDATCPFRSGTCLLGDTEAFAMTTDMIDSHVSLGINAPTTERISFRRSTTCAPLHTANYTTVVPGQLPQERIQMFFYGNVSMPDVVLNTYNVSTYAIASASGYVLSYVNSYASVLNSNFANVFIPAPDFTRADADVNFFFLAPNDISFTGPSDDPFFPAHLDPYTLPQAPGVTFYRPDVWSSVLGCIDQYQVCNPAASGGQTACTPLVGLPSLESETNKLNLSPAQSSTTDVLRWALKETGLSSSIAGRGAAALRAQSTVYSNRQGPLPNNQWTIEVAGWFDTALAKLQFAIVEFARGPDARDAQVMQVAKPAMASTCNVKVRSSAYMNFSLLGVGLIYGLGLFLIVLSWTVDSLVGKVQDLIGKGVSRKMRWILDGRLQLLRQLYEKIAAESQTMRSNYEWDNVNEAIPTLPGFAPMADVVKASPHLGRGTAYGYKHEDVEIELQELADNSKYTARHLWLWMSLGASSKKYNIS